MQLRIRTAALCAAIAFALGVSTQADATSVAVKDNTWYSFDVDDLMAQSSGVEWIDNQIAPGGYVGDGSALSFTFNLSDPTYLVVVDAGFGGDRFSVFDNGSLLGSTTGGTDTYPLSVSTNFDAAYADASYSKGLFLLGVGSHTITGVLSRSALDDVGSPFNATVGAISLQAIPEPGSVALFLSGLGLLAACMRRRHV